MIYYHHYYNVFIRTRTFNFFLEWKMTIWSHFFPMEYPSETLNETWEKSWNESN